MAIENAFVNLLPNQLTKLEQTPGALEDFTNESLKVLYATIIIYFIVIVFLICIYSILIYMTNKSMGEGLEMVGKIKQEKIEEILKN